MRVLNLFVVLFVFHVLNAQSIDTSKQISAVKKKSRYDTTYIYQFERKLVLRSIIASRNFTLIVSPKNNIENSENLSIKYKPNIGNYYGLGASYNNLYFQMLLSIPNSQKPENEYGVTQYTDLHLSFHHDNLNETFFYQKFKGLYSEIDYFGNKHTVIREDIEILKTGIRIFYQFNEKFSVHSVYKQTQLQKKSTGAWMIRMDAYYQRITADSSFLQTKIQNEQLSEINDLLKIRHYALNFQLGYAYNFPIAKCFFISPFVFAGIGPQQIQSNNSDSKKYSVNYSANFKLFAGYAQNRIVASVIFDTQYHFTPTKLVSIYTNLPFLQFSVGYRFNLRNPK